MTNLRVPFATPHFSDEDLELIVSELRAVLKSGWLTSGKNVERFENQFAEFIGTSHAVALNSCTAALHSILLALGIRSGDEVIVPANTFVATANVVLYVGAKPVFADADPETFNLSVEDVKKRITRRTKAIIPVHLAGNPCDMKQLSEIAQENKLNLIEDCAHAHGANFQGKKCGTFGIAAAFSFYPTKVITSGEGGMVTTDDKNLAEKIKRLRNHGRGGYGPLEITELGYNYRMPDILAAIGLNQLGHIEKFLAIRQKLAIEYTSFFSNFKWIRPQIVRDGNLSSYYAFVVKLTSSAPFTRDFLLMRLKEQGVGGSVLYHPVHTQPFYLDSYGNGVECPVATELGQNSLALPIYNGMGQTEFEYVKSQLEGVISEASRPTVGTN